MLSVHPACYRFTCLQLACIGPNIVYNYILILLSNFFFNANSIILIIAYSHFGTPTDSAKIGIALAIVSPVYVLLSLQHAISINANKLNWASSVKTRAYIAPIGIIFSLFASMYFKNSAIFLFSLIKAAEYFYEPLFYRHIQLGRYKKLAKETLVRFTLSTIITFYILSDEPAGLNFSLTILALLQAFLTLVALLPIIKEVVNADRASIHEDIPLGIGALLASIAANIPRYFLTGGPVDDLAFYSNTLSIVFGLTFVFTSLNTLVLQKFVGAEKNGMWKYQVRSISIGVIALIVICVLFATNTFVAVHIVKILLGENYVNYANNVILFAIFYVILYFQAVANSTLTYTGSKRFIALYNLLYLVSITIALYWFAEKSAQDTIITVIYTIGLITLLSFTFALYASRTTKP